MYIYMLYFNLLAIVWFVVTDKPCEAGSRALKFVYVLTCIYALVTEMNYTYNTKYQVNIIIRYAISYAH